MKRILAFVLAIALSASVASAATTIGNGFSCSGTSLLKGGKSISYSKAKSNLTTTIANLKKKLAAAPKKKKPAIKAQIKTASTSKTLITACIHGTLAPNEVDPIFKSLASGTGTFTGNYSGSVSGFLPLSGTVTVYFILDGTNLSAELSLGGELNSTLKGKPLTFTGDVGGIGFPAEFLLQGTFLGDVTLSITQAGHIAITNTGNANPEDFEAQYTDPNIDGTLNGSYSGFSYTGSFHLTRS